MILRPLMFGLVVLTASATAAAAAPAPWDAAFAQALPEETLAKLAIDADPDVTRARADLALARAEDKALDVGRYEFVAGVNTADNWPHITYDLQRTVRLPGKAALDRKAGALGVKAAEDLVDDARHQTGLRLSDAWYAWIEAVGQVGLDADTEASLRRDVEALARRVQEKDASQLDLEQAQAALAAATSRLAQSRGKAETAHLALLRGFPDLAAPASPPALPAPPALDPPASTWRDITVRSSHEIAIADYKAQQAETLAARARMDRTPDPTIGVRAIPDVGNRIRGVGVYLTTPIGGRYRSAVAEAEAARASAAKIELFKVRRETAALGERNAVASEASRLAWSSAQDAVAAAQAAAQRTARGYQLGELDLAAVLLAQRQLYDARRSEISARVEAWRAVTHLRLDAHDLWHDDD